MISIEDNIPAPRSAGDVRSGGRSAGYPFADLLVGQSFAVPAPEGWKSKQTQSFVSTARTFARRRGWRFTVAVRDAADGSKECRVWRIA